jgi:hypothetical protein
MTGQKILGKLINRASAVVIFLSIFILVEIFKARLFFLTSE